MKKLLTLCLGFIPCAALAATNKISMVTFFPVPYVAYSQLKATDQMDIGLTNSCDMTLGCSEASATLNATQVKVKGGKLTLDGGRGIIGDVLSLGNGNNDGKISFQNVRIQTGNMESVNAQGMTVSNLKLFGKAFPSCKDANSASSGQMQWTSLKLKGADSKELYLACGGLDSASEPKADCSDRTYKLANKRECCAGTSTSDTDCWRQDCSYHWVDGRMVGAVSGTSGYDNAASPKGYCNTGLCRPSYSGNSVSGSYFGGCISSSNALTILEKVNFKKCSATYKLGDICGAHQENEQCYNNYEYRDSGGAPCLYYNIQITNGLKCQKSCSYVKTY